jgi:hypothetical protein
MVIGLVVSLLGLVVSWVMFTRFPRLDGETGTVRGSDVSVVIPARDEPATLPRLLASLAASSVCPLEVIVVDDESSDATALVARAGGARVIATPPRPQGWLGKTWACQTGLAAAKGAHVLLLDADVWLEPNALTALLAAYGPGDVPISVLPYHAISAGYEQLTLFFNTLAFGVCGAGLPHPYGNALFGPTILVSRASLDAVGGYTGVRSNIVDDVALGHRFIAAGRRPKLFAGRGAVSIRMYAGGFDKVVEGWSKNAALGALMTPWPLRVAATLWGLGCVLAPVDVVVALARGAWATAGLAAASYLIWAVELARIARWIGDYRWTTVAAYPVALAVFVGVFVRSAWRRLTRRPVRWKGRDIDNTDT